MAIETDHEDSQHLFEMIREIKFAMLTTTDLDGSLRSRPMANRQADEFTGELWFFTHASSHMVQEFERAPQVNISFADPDNQNYVSISGTAELVRDPAKIEELWTPALKTWFRDGVDDPDIGLIKVTVTKAEFWDSPSSKMVRAYVFAKAALTGDYSGIGEDKKLTFAS
jgi:general stress protein 26